VTGRFCFIINDKPLKLVKRHWPQARDADIGSLTDPHE